MKRTNKVAKSSGVRVKSLSDRLVSLDSFLSVDLIVLMIAELSLGSCVGLD